MAINKTQHLESVIKTHQISKEKTLLDKFKERNAEVKEVLEDNYGAKLYAPFNSGSYAKNTAVNIKFDFDLISPFKRSSFDTLKKMYEDVYDFLHDKFKNVATVRKQKVSIGIEFFADSAGDIVKIDVVPGRELNQDQYSSDHNLNLYVYSQYGTLEEGSERIKTNIEAQISNIRDRATNEKESIRKIIRLLKVWKIKNYKTPKSFFLELVVLKAFDNKEISGTLWDKLQTVLSYIRDEASKEGFTLTDPGNSGNNLADTLTQNDKETLSNDMKYLLERVEDDADNIKIYFPENQKFVENDESNNKYSNEGSGSLFSIPPSTERFG